MPQAFVLELDHWCCGLGSLPSFTNQDLKHPEGVGYTVVGAAVCQLEHLHSLVTNISNLAHHASPSLRPV